MAATPDPSALADAIARATRHSPFLKWQLERHAEITALLQAGAVEEAIAGAKVRADDDPVVSLRRERGALALALGIADLAGAIPLDRVVQELSDFADASLDRALAQAVAERTPNEAPRGFAVIALGKHGSRELNYSSDIDPIFLFDPDTLPRRAREEPLQAAVRTGQRVMEILQKRDANGYVFRVDLRLRPTPEVTPIALPVEAAISYYESSALAWERAAFIRARAAAGDRALGAAFLNAVHPFVWRRSLDYGTAAEIRAITARIRSHYAQGQALGPGYDLKRGRGGIREVEFSAQIHQLIHGGRTPALRVGATLDALRALAETRVLPDEETRRLSDAYRLLRTIEHRLQMVDDRQTHSLPPDPAAIDNVARLHGLEHGGELIALLAPVTATVAQAYDALEADGGAQLPRDAAALDASLAVFGFTDAAGARMRVEGWRSGKFRALRTPAAMDAFEAMLPKLLAALGKAADPAHAINRFDDIVARLPSGVNLFRLVEAQPALGKLLATVLSHAPPLAEQLGARPELLDGLISQSAFEPAPPVAEIAAALGRPGRPGEDYQMLLDRVRRQVNESRFALGVQLVSGIADPLAVAAGYGRVAEAAVQALADAASAEFARTHGRVPGSELVILGLGRLGGGALTHASDLDLIFLFTGSFDACSDGMKSLGATDYFNRLAGRIVAALSVPTAAGSLYEVDTRLRPSGKDGLLAVSADSFAAYHADSAWIWEHMALTRARPVHGSAEARAEAARVLKAILARPRDAAAVRKAAAEMRAEIARHKPPAGPFDIKLGPGGLVDLEFAVQALQLSRGVLLPADLGGAVQSLAAQGLLPDGLGQAHDLLTRMLIVLRLVSPGGAEPPEASRAAVAQACGAEDWQALLAAHANARQSIAEAWRKVAAGEEARYGE